MFPEELIRDHKTVIVAVLNWGLGHACRSMPIIDALIQNKKKVIIASDGIALEILADRYPKLEFETLPAYNVKYNSSKLTGIVFGNAFKVGKAILHEKLYANRLVTKYNADLVISDSRFGFRSKKCKSVIISHQLMMHARSAIMKLVMNVPNRLLLNAFDEVWVPDYQDRRLTGILSKNKKIKNQTFIGPLSTLKKSENPKDYDMVILLSGPEPARTRLEISLVNAFKDSDKRVVLIRGTNEKPLTQIPSSWLRYDLANRSEVETALLSTEEVIGRSGYTSIMDYYTLGISAQLIPTPGQSEQEYLAEYLNGKYGFRTDEA